MMLGSILNPINSSIIAVSLVPIGAAFGEPASQTAWLVSALYLATSIGQPVVGRLIDRFGPRPLFLIGAALVGIAGVVGMAATNLGMLIAARVILGFGTCSGYPAAMRLIRSEGERTGVASPSSVLSALSVSTQTIAVIGPTLGGLLIAIGGWRATFAVNIPLGLAALALGYLYMPELGGAANESEGLASFDIPGILLFASTLLLLLLFLMDITTSELWLLALAIVVCGLFAIRELRTPTPFVDLRVLGGNTPLLITYARGTLAATISYCFLYGFTQWLEMGRGLHATAAGLVLLPVFGIGIVVVSITGRRPEIRAKLLVGVVMQIVGCALLQTVHGTSPIIYIAMLAAVFGVPQGLVNLAIQNTLYHQADAETIGAASGLLRTFMYLGAMLASSAIGGFFGSHANTTGMHHLALFMLAIAVVLLTITVLDRSLARVDRQARQVNA